MIFALHSLSAVQSSRVATTLLKDWCRGVQDSLGLAWTSDFKEYNHGTSPGPKEWRSGLFDTNLLRSQTSVSRHANV